MYIYAITIMMVINAVINALHEIYNCFPIAKERSVKGYVQVAKVYYFSLGLFSYSLHSC